MMEAMTSFETLAVTYNTAQRNNPEDHNPQFHLTENLKSLSNFILDNTHFQRFSDFTHFVASVSSSLSCQSSRHYELDHYYSIITKHGNNPAVLYQIFQVAGDRLSESLYDNKTAVTNNLYVYTEIKIRSNSGNACYYSDQNILSYGMQSIKKRNKSKDAHTRTIILPVLFYGCDTWSAT
jgi:hypothetical protein